MSDSQTSPLTDPSADQPLPKVPDGSLEIPILPGEGTLEPLDFRNRKASERRPYVRHVQPDRSPMLALTAGLLVATGAGAVLWLWVSFAL